MALIAADGVSLSTDIHATFGIATALVALVLLGCFIQQQQQLRTELKEVQAWRHTRSLLNNLQASSSSSGSRRSSGVFSARSSGTSSGTSTPRQPDTGTLQISRSPLPRRHTWTVGAPPVNHPCRFSGPPASGEACGQAAQWSHHHDAMRRLHLR